MRPWIQIIAALDSYFADRFNSFLVLDMPGVATFFWRTFKPFLAERTREKVQFLSSTSSADMAALFARIHADDATQKMLDKLLNINRSLPSDTGRNIAISHTSNFLRELPKMVKARGKHHCIVDKPK